MSKEKPGFLQVLSSVTAAMFGVQSDKNRQRDFSQGNMTPYIVSGAIFVVLFVLCVFAVANFALSA